MEIKTVHEKQIVFLLCFSCQTRMATLRFYVDLTDTSPVTDADCITYKRGMEVSQSESLFDGLGQEGPIRSIFFCEFHPTAGPIISCQVDTTNEINKTPISISLILGT